MVSPGDYFIVYGYMVLNEAHSVYEVFDILLVIVGRRVFYSLSVARKGDRCFGQ